FISSNCSSNSPNSLAEVLATRTSPLIKTTGGLSGAPPFPDRRTCPAIDTRRPEEDSSRRSTDHEPNVARMRRGEGPAPRTPAGKGWSRLSKIRRAILARLGSEYRRNHSEYAVRPAPKFGSGILIRASPAAYSANVCQNRNDRIQAWHSF